MLDAEATADWLELYLLRRQVGAIGNQAAVELVVASGLADRATAEIALNVIGRRVHILGAHHPLRSADVGFQTVRSPQSQAYCAMLVLSQGGNSRLARKAPIIFEHMVVVAARRLLGEGAAAMRFAWPSDTTPARPPDFAGAIRWLAKMTGLPLGAGYRPPRRQDGGVDVVAWRPFPDEKPGFPLMLVQATLDRNCLDKSRDIDIRLWSTWLAWDVEPATALAIPYTVGRHEDWLEMSRRTTVLDRLRLAHLLAEASLPDLVLGWLDVRVEELVDV